MKDLSLEQIISQTGPLPPRRVAELGLSILAEMTASRGEAGRDIRPDKVIVRADGTVSLTSGTRAPGELPAFLPPEGLAGPASELWTLGATLFTAVEGYPPAPGVSPKQAGPLTEVLTRLLAAAPEQRPDAGTLRDRLREAARQAAEKEAAAGRPGGPAAGTPPAAGNDGGPLAAPLAQGVGSGRDTPPRSARDTAGPWPGAPAGGGWGGTGPTFPGAGTPGETGPTLSRAPGRGRGVFVPLPIVVLTAVLMVAMAVAIGVLITPVFRDAPSAATATPAPSPSGSGKGAFATVPRACSLLDDALVDELVPNAHISEVSTGECNWLTTDWRIPRSIRYDLRLRLTAYKVDGTELTMAQNHFKGRKEDFTQEVSFTTPKPAPPQDLTGIGEESFAFTKKSSINIFGGAVVRVVVFRVSNVVGELEYMGGGAEDDKDGLLAKRSEKAARAIVEALKNYG